MLWEEETSDTDEGKKVPLLCAYMINFIKGKIWMVLFLKAFPLQGIHHDFAVYSHIDHGKHYYCWINILRKFCVIILYRKVLVVVCSLCEQRKIAFYCKANITYPDNVQ